MLPLHLLRHFHAVATEGGFSRAAEALHISQPAISRAVRELENHAGSPLVERSAGPFRLTEAGIVLLARARELLAVERAAEEDLAALRGLTGGRLAIGASTTIAEYHVPPVIAGFHRAYPGVALRLISANTHDIAESLAALQVDIALVEGRVDDPRFTVTPWQQEAIDLVAAPGHPLAGALRLEAADLEGATFVVREPGSGTRTVADAMLRRLGLARFTVLEAGSTTAVKKIVAAGLGIAVVPRAAATDQCALGTLKTLPVALGERILWQLRLPQRRPGPAAKVFEEYLAAEGVRRRVGEAQALGVVF